MTEHASDAANCVRSALMWMVAGVTTLTGCASVDPLSGFSEIEKATKERLGAELAWREDGESRASELTASLLDEELSADGAVQVGLLRNPGLRATFERLGIAHADLMQAGLLENPVLAASPRFGLGSISGTNFEGELAQNLLRLLTRRSRKEVAALEFSEVRLGVAREVIRFAAEVRQSHLELVAARHQVDMLRTIQEAASVSTEYAKRLRDAGNVSELAHRREQALLNETSIALGDAKANEAVALAQLESLLGSAGDRPLRTPTVISPLPKGEVDPDHLEHRSVDSRFDLQAMDREIEALEQAYALARTYRWVPFLEAGVSAEREAEGGWVIGPQLALEIPLFDRGQASMARYESMLRERRHSREALVLSVKRDVRSGIARTRAARSRANRILKELIPVRERIVELTQREYNYMLVGAFDLLAAKRDEIESYQTYVVALRDYWSARNQLEAAVGGELPTREPTATESPPRPDANPPSHQHHHHQGHH